MILIHDKLSLRSKTMNYVGTLKCTKCLVVKSQLRFSGILKVCKICQAKATANWRQKLGVEKFREINRQWQQNWRDSHPGLNTIRVKECMKRKRENL